MKVLVAEDDAVSRYVLEAMLENWGYDLVLASNGTEAWEALQVENPPRLALFDWVMPDLDGLEICRRIREQRPNDPLYIILLTGRAAKHNIVEALEAGADDYVIKPYAREELRARVAVGARLIELQNDLAQRVRQLQDALSQVKQLQGILPICSHCKKVRADKDYWQQVESYVSEHTAARFSHSICPDCFEAVVKPEIADWERKLT
jgi:DNA-binding response OmpR family regulator